MNNNTSWLVKSVALLCILISGLGLMAQSEEYPEVTGSKVVWISSKPGIIGFGQDKDNPAPAMDFVKYLKDSSVAVIYLEGAKTPNGLLYENSDASAVNGAFILPPGKIVRGGCDFSSTSGLQRLGFTSILKAKSAQGSPVGRVVNMYGKDSHLAVLSGVMIIGNGIDAAVNGAGVRMGGFARLEKSLVKGCQTKSGDDTMGGGVFLDGSQNTISECMIYDNFATKGGGVAVNQVAGLKGNLIINSLVACNASLSLGGGILGANNGSELAVRYCTIASNSVFEPKGATGLAILATGASASGNGVINTIIWGNSRSETFPQFLGPSFSFSAIEGWSGETTNVISLPSDNTGLNGVRFVNPIALPARADLFINPILNYRTTELSSTIAKGTTLPNVNFDLDGKERPSKATQIGAYELNGVISPIDELKVCYVRETEFGEADGTSWKNAYGAGKLIEVALSTQYDVVNVAAGNYVLDATLKLSAGKRLFGGFTGNENEVRDWLKNETIITRTPVVIPYIIPSGDGTPPLNDDPRNAPLVELTYNGALFDGFVIDGQRKGTIRGGAVYTTNVNSGVKIVGATLPEDKNSVLMQSCRVRNCSSQSQLYYDPKTNQYKRNSKLGEGSAVNLEGSSVTLRDLIIEDNYAINVDASALYIKGDSNLISSIKIANNAAGGVFEGTKYESTGTISINGMGNRFENGLVVNNEAQRAGAIISTGDLTVVNCTITHNISRAPNNNNGGKAVAIFMDDINLTNTIIWNNSGGAVSNRTTRYKPPYILSRLVSRGSNIQVDNASLTDGDGFEYIYSEISRDPGFSRVPVEVGPFSDWERFSWELATRSSPCFGTGISDFATRGDITGTPWGTKIDIGAYAYKETTPIRVLYVTEFGSGTQDGRSWDTAVDSTRLAIMINFAGVEEVRLGSGTYYGERSGKHAFTIPEGIWLRGGFYNGFKQNPASVKTILSPSPGLSQRVISITRRANQSWHTQIDNLNLKGGRVYYDFDKNEYEEGGALITIPNLLLLATTFEDNEAANGGAVSAGSGSEFRGCLFLENRTKEMALGGNIGNGGGAIATGTAKFINTEFRENIAQYAGGGLNARDQVSIEGCLFNGNEATDPLTAPNDVRGGGASISGEVTVNKTRFISNRSDRYGGGLFARGGRKNSTADNSFEITDCIFGEANPNAANVLPENHFGNVALWGGGLYIAENYDVYKSRFDYNIAAKNASSASNDDALGGAIMVGKSEAISDNVVSTNIVTISKSKFYRNTAREAAILYAVASHGAHYFYNNLVTNNESVGTRPSMITYAETKPPGRPISPVGYTTFTENICQDELGNREDRNFFRGPSGGGESTNNVFWGNSSENGPGNQYRSYPGSTSDGVRADDRRIVREAFYYSPFKNPGNFDGVWNQDARLPVPNPQNIHGVPTIRGEEDPRELPLPADHGTGGEETHIGQNVWDNINNNNPATIGGGCGIRGFNESANWRLTCQFTWNNADIGYPGEAGTPQNPRRDWSGWDHATFVNDPDPSTIRTSPSGRGWLGLTSRLGLFTITEDMDDNERRAYDPAREAGYAKEMGTPRYLGNTPGCYAYFAVGTNDNTPEEIVDQFTMVRMLINLGNNTGTYKLIKDITIHNEQGREPNLVLLPDNGRYFTPSIPFRGKFIGDVDIDGNPVYTVTFEVDPLAIGIRVGAKNETCKGMFSMVYGLVDGIGARVSNTSWRYSIHTNANQDYILDNLGVIVAVSQESLSRVRNVKVTVDTGIALRAKSVGAILGKDLSQGVNKCFLTNCRSMIYGHLVGLGDNGGINPENLVNVPPFSQDYTSMIVGEREPTYAGGIVGRRVFYPDDGFMELFGAQVQVAPAGSIRASRAGGVIGTYDGLKQTFFRDCLVDIHGVLQGSQNAAGICATNVTFAHDCYAHFSRNSVFTCGTVVNGIFVPGTKMGGLVGGTSQFEPVNDWYAFPDETLLFEGNSSITNANRLWLTRNFSKFAIPAKEDMGNNKDVFVIPMRRVDIPVDDGSTPIAYYNDLAKHKEHLSPFGLMSKGIHSEEYASVSSPNSIMAKKQTTSANMRKNMTTDMIKNSNPNVRNYVKPFSFTVSPTPYSSFSPEFDLFVTSKVRPNPRDEGKIFVTLNGGSYPTRSRNEESYNKESYLPYGSTWEYAVGGNIPVKNGDVAGAKTMLDEAFDAEFVRDVIVGAGVYEIETPINMTNNQKLIGSCEPVGAKGYKNNVISTMSAWDHKDQTYIYTRAGHRLIEATVGISGAVGNYIYGIQFDAQHLVPLVDHASAFNSNGGAIASNGRIDLLNSSVKNAWTTDNGGGVYINVNEPDSKVTIANVSITNCSSETGTGGALHITGSSNIEVKNVLFANNTADTCGAFDINVGSTSPSTKIDKSTVVRNKTRVGSYDCYIKGIASGILVSNSLIWGNATTVPIDFASTGVTIENTAIDAAFPAGNNIKTPVILSRENEGIAPNPPYRTNYFTGPRFVNPAPFESMGAQPMKDAKQWDWRLKYASPCINTGKLNEPTP